MVQAQDCLDETCKSCSTVCMSNVAFNTTDGAEVLVVGSFLKCFIEAANFDPMLIMGASTLVLGCHYGDLEAIAAAFDRMVETATRAQLDPERDTGAAFGTCNLMSRQWPYIFGKGSEFGVVLSDFVGRTWTAIDAWCDEASDELVWFPPRGEPLTGAQVWSLDTICWCAKFVRSRSSHLAVIRS